MGNIESLELETLEQAVIEALADRLDIKFTRLGNGQYSAEFGDYSKSRVDYRLCIQVDEESAKDPLDFVLLRIQPSLDFDKSNEEVYQKLCLEVTRINYFLAGSGLWKFVVSKTTGMFGLETNMFLPKQVSHRMSHYLARQIINTMQIWKMHSEKLFEVVKGSEQKPSSGVSAQQKKQQQEQQQNVLSTSVA